MEHLKRLEDICSPDPRNANRVLVDLDSGQSKPLTIAEVHAGLSVSQLGEAVPENIRDHFQTARHLMLYSWFVYRFLSVAQMQAYASLEFALRERLGHRNDERPPGLKALLRSAIAQGLLVDDRFSDWPGHQNEELRVSGRPAAWIQDLLMEYVTYFRNNLAHGSHTLMPDGGRTLRVVADAINQLYSCDVAAW